MVNPLFNCSNATTINEPIILISIAWLMWWNFVLYFLYHVIFQHLQQPCLNVLRMIHWLLRMKILWIETFMGKLIGFPSIDLRWMVCVEWIKASWIGRKTVVKKLILPSYIHLRIPFIFCSRIFFVKLLKLFFLSFKTRKLEGWGLIQKSISY